MSPDIVSAPLIESALEPGNWQESLLYRAVDPANYALTQTIHLIAVAILAVLVLIATLGTTWSNVYSLVETYHDYEYRVRTAVLEVLLHQNWVGNGLSDEDRRGAANRILDCARRRSLFLDLSGLNLTTLPAEIGQLDHLEYLYISGDYDRYHLTSLPKEIGNLKNLKELYLDRNQLSSLPDAIWDLKNLTKLDLRNNPIGSLSPKIGQLGNLKILGLRNTDISSLPEEICNLSSLKQLDLGCNRFTSVPIQIEDFRCLEELKLDENQLTTLPSFIFNFPSTTEINAENNRFSADYVAFVEDYCIAHICPEITVSISNPRDLFEEWGSTLQRSSATMGDLLQALIGGFTTFPEDIVLDLNASILPWKRLLPEQQWPDFRVLEEHRYTGQLIKFLDRIVETKDYQDASELGRKHYAERVMRILSLMVESADYREIAFCDIDGGVNTCGDALDLVLNNLEILSYVYAGNKDKTMLELAVIAIGLIRLGRIKTFALRYRSVDPVEVELSLQVRLREQLKLPINTKSMLYPKVGKIPADVIGKFAAEVKEQTSSRESIIGALLLQKFWKRRLWEENETYNTIALEVGERTDLNPDEIIGLTNEKLEALYLADTEKWYDANETVLAAALTPPPPPINEQKID